MALTDTGGRTGDADAASGSRTQQASWEKGLIKIPEPASASDPDQSPFEFQKQRPFQCETPSQGFLLLDAVRELDAVLGNTHARTH